MIPVSNKYKQVMDKMIRNRAYISIGIGVITQEAQASASASGSFTFFSDLSNIFDNVNEYKEYATFEQNYWKADGSQYLVPRGSVYLDTGLTTNAIKGTTKVSFDNTYNLKGLTINFGSAYPTSFTVTTSDNRVFTFSNNKEIFTTETLLGETSSLLITPLVMLGGNQRMRIHSMLMGVGVTFTNSDVENFEKSEYMSAIAEEISSKTFNVTVFDIDNIFNVDDDNSFINFLETKQEITTSFGLELDDGTVEWINGSKTYLSEWKSTNGKMSFTSTDILSQMDDDYTLGNKIYTRTAYEEAESILQDLGYEPDEYIIDDYLNDITLVNPMPSNRHSECLQILANATRCVCYQDIDGKVVIKPNFTNVVSPTSINITASNSQPYSSVGNLLDGSSVVYVDFSTDYWTVDDTMWNLPSSASQYSNKTGYISNVASNANGVFDTVPKVTLTLPNALTYYSIKLRFDRIYPTKVRIDTYNGTTLKEQNTFDVDSLNPVLFHEFEKFDKMEIHFLETEKGNQLVHLAQVGLGMLTDYTLSRQNMMENPIGYKEQSTKSVSVKVCTYENDSKGNPKEVQDDVWYTNTINSVGVNVAVNNPLVDNIEMAQTVAEWIGDYYKNNIKYDVSYRGEPRLACGDIIGMESEILNNMQVEIGQLNLKYNGSFSGSLQLRKYLQEGAE